jgi:hypothetical protein
MKGNKFLVNSICLSNIHYEPVGEAIITGWGNVVPINNQNINVKNLQKGKYKLGSKQKCD